MGCGFAVRGSMTVQGRRALVTGAGGFIGSHLVERLVHDGATVTAFVRYNSRGDVGLLAALEPALQREIQIVAGDLRDAEAVRQAMAGAELVFHLGALIAIPYSYRHPREVVETNVLGTLNVLLAARDQDVARLVHVSSSEVYGTATRVPMDETHPLHVQSPYAASKLGADKLAEAFHLTYGLPVALVRPFNAFGPRQSARAVIPTIVSQALAGDRVRLGNLEARRDWTYVTDTVAGMLAAAEAPGAVGLTVNLGTGRGLAVGEVVELVGRLLGKRLQVEVQAERQRPPTSEVERLVADASLAERVLGWRPTVPFEQGLERVIEWVRAEAHRYRPEQYAV